VGSLATSPIAAFQAAWNAHDMIAFGALFNENVTLTNPRTGEAILRA
jgi:hypothetical protein